MSFGLGISFGRLCGGRPKKVNDTLMFIHEMFHKIEDRGLQVDTMSIDVDLFEKIQNHVQGNSLWGAEITLWNNFGIVQLMSKPDEHGRIVVESDQLNWHSVFDCSILLESYAQVLEWQTIGT